MPDITLGARRENGRFNFVRTADGDVQFDETEAHSVATSAVERKGSWWADPSHGSELYTLTSLTRAAPSQAEAMVFEAEQPLVKDSKIAGVSVAAEVERSNGQPTGRLNVAVRWTTPGGRAQSVRVGV